MRIRDIGQAVDGAGEQQNRGLGQRQAGHPAGGLQAAGRQRHRDRGSHQGAAAATAGGHPAAVKVDVLSDRTTTIRASVGDVQFTLMLTIVLVVMVIFIFLRNFWATADSERHGAAGADRRVRGHVSARLQPRQPVADGADASRSASWSTMRSSMLENIDRHVEEGLSPVEAAIKGSGEIGFTIVSISLSLVAVFIPLLLMGGIVGRAVPRVRRHRHDDDRWSRRSCR